MIVTPIWEIEEIEIDIGTKEVLFVSNSDSKTTITLSRKKAKELIEKLHEAMEEMERLDIPIR